MSKVCNTFSSICISLFSFSNVGVFEDVYFFNTLLGMFFLYNPNLKNLDRLERILTMVYVVQIYWACFGLYPSSCMWKTKYHNVSETGSVSVLRWMGEHKPTQLGPLERASLNHWTNPGP
jgi:hypothetical protein